MPGPGYELLGDEERRAVREVCADWSLTRYLFDDPEEDSRVRGFERRLAERSGSPHCIAVNSGTSALATALAGVGVAPGDEVIVPGYTYVATIGVVGMLGAVPVLAEVDDSLTLAPEDVAARITERTVAVVAVHMLGVAADLDALRRLCSERGLWLVEDCAQACGGSYRGRALGSIGDAGTFSFNPYKVITCGEGGAVLFDRPDTYATGYAYQDQGWPPLRDNSGHGVGAAIFGQNLRMPELSAAVGLVQLGRLDEVLGRTRSLAARWRECVELPAGVVERHRHDPDGDCANAVVYTFDDVATAEATARKIGASTLVDSGRHYYGNMPQLVQTDAPEYARGRLPRTDDLLSRSVAVSIGVKDAHLGTGFGPVIGMPAERVDMLAEEFSEALDGVLR